MYTRAVHLSNVMLINLSDFVITLTNLLWENLNILESQYQPLEAANRIERAMQLKTSSLKSPSAAATAEALPGCESEVWAKQKFVLILHEEFLDGSQFSDIPVYQILLCLSKFKKEIGEICLWSYLLLVLYQSTRSIS